MNQEPTAYATPADWLRHNRKTLFRYSGEWIAFTNTGIISHNKDGHTALRLARQTQLDYALKYVHPLEVSRVVRIVPIRIRSLKNDRWQPDYTVIISTTSTSETLTMLVDSGADITVIPRWTGEDLGLTLFDNEYIAKAEGVNGTVDYVIRSLTFSLDGHVFEAPVGWIQTDGVDDILLGREVVFDLFDVEFKQAEETIIFKKRSIT
jgi:predicted aspartyl protease